MLATRAGSWGVYARRLDTGETVAIRADEVMPAQSSMKVGVLLAYTKRVRLGNEDPNRRVSLQRAKTTNRGAAYCAISHRACPQL